MTCDAIRAICEADGKRYVVMIAVSQEGTQFTTWGRTPEDKIEASAMAKWLGETICEPTPAVYYESFQIEAAQNKAKLEALRDAVTISLQQLDELAELWGDEGKFRRVRDRMREALKPEAVV